MNMPDNTKCPSECLRPVGLAFDGKGRLFVSSDSTGEVSYCVFFLGKLLTIEVSRSL